VKGKGAVEVWRLLGPRSTSSIPGAEPPPTRLQDLKAP
jgi:hypothetical protein